MSGGWRNILAGLAMGIILLLAAAYPAKTYATWALRNDCAKTVFDQIPSPDGSRQVFVFHIDCGATTGFNTQVSVQPAGTGFAPFEYVSFFAADGEDIPLKVDWQDRNSLAITIPDGMYVQRQLPADRGVEIIYRMSAD